MRHVHERKEFAHVGRELDNLSDLELVRTLAREAQGLLNDFSDGDDGKEGV